MKTMKRTAALALCLVMALCLCACAVPGSRFADYDVSGYIQSLLDCSYHGDTEALMDTASMTAEEAKAYNDTTVSNAAVNFCNAYGLAPTAGELGELEIIMRQALLLTKYTVTDERKTDSGYYLEVEVAPIVNFQNRQTDMNRMRSDSAQPGAEKSFMAMVLDFCKKELANISYGAESRMIPLDILLTDEGELQLDMNQIDTIDATVLLFE